MDQSTHDLQPIIRTIAGREIAFDGEGFLNSSLDWDEEVCQELAREQGLAELGERHWRVIRFLRSFYESHGRAPLNAQLKKGTGLSLLEIGSLFPGGIKQGARLLAGLPNPKTCT